jgi:hypothetical protein
MPRGRPKGWKKMSVYERTKVKRIRDILSQKGISKFDKLRDSQIFEGIHIDSNGEIFVKYGLPGTKKRGHQQKTSEGVKILNKLERNLATLRDLL